MKSNNFILILVVILIFGCSNNKMIDNSFFYNTEYLFKEETCNPLSIGKKNAYEVYSGNFIYNCDLDRRNHTDSFGVIEKDSTSVFIVMNKHHEIINELSFTNINKAFKYWFIGYDNNYLMAFRTTDTKNSTTELIRINLKSNELTILIDNLPKGNYGISEHPISKNDILVFSSKGWAYVLDIKNKKLHTKVFECKGIYSPVISKDGKLITYLFHNKVYVYNIKTGKQEIMFDLNSLNNYHAFRVYFKNNEELVVKGNKYTGNYLLEYTNFLVIKNKKIIEKGQLHIDNGYKYH
ncbi:hypothetical protein HNV10_05670 [Winogradskyella litoriviva]|uniref:WD40 repeat protein n=1 Tax=Winogradskyella litoriviva TaxID=1220182 RepID=A0ABX2E3U0_9FLAO|nr:hypothetical protein [Winogradskyella litoriviva]NRD22718.1 hypothetical protein [Winogradskyella litoriviva]